MDTVIRETPPFVLRGPNLLGEGPLWSPRTQALYWIDASTPFLWHWRWGAPAAQAWPLPRPPAALALLEDGRLLIAFRARMALVAFPGAPLEELDLPGLDLGDERFNDAKVDAQGRLWIGTIDRAFTQPVGRLYRIDRQAITPMDSGFVLSNGIGWSPDSRTMYFAESASRRIHRYAFDTATGEIRKSGVLAELAQAPPIPDGLTVDADGGIWCAIFGGGCLHRYHPDGRLDRVLRVPVTNPTSCIFGGPDMRTLFVTSASYGLTEPQRRDEPDAGNVFAFEMSVAGLPEPFLDPDCIVVRNRRAAPLERTSP